MIVINSASTVSLSPLPYAWPNRWLTSALLQTLSQLWVWATYRHTALRVLTLPNRRFFRLFQFRTTQMPLLHCTWPNRFGNLRSISVVVATPTSSFIWAYTPADTTFARQVLLQREYFWINVIRLGISLHYGLMYNRWKEEGIWLTPYIHTYFDTRPWVTQDHPGPQ